MKSALQNALPVNKNDMDLRLNKLIREYNNIKKKIKRKEELQERFYNLSSLVGSHKRDTKEEIKELAKDKNKMLAEGAKKLKEASRATEDANRTAINIISTMQDQRVRLENAADTITTMQGNAKVSESYIKGMERKEFIYKGLLIAIVALLFVVILTLLYIKIHRR